MAASTNRNTSPHNPYPSPPLEYASLELPPSRRNGSISSVFRGPPWVDSRSHDGFVLSPTLQSTELPPLTHKSSKTSLRHVGVERTPSAVNRGDATDPTRHRVLTKARPTTPQKQGTSSYHKVLPQPGDPLLLDDDPFARVGGVKMLKPRARSSSGASVCMSKEDISSSEEGQAKMSNTPPKTPLTPASSEDALMPGTSDNYKTARQQRRGQWLEKAPPSAVAEVVAKQMAEVQEQPPREPTPLPTHFPIVAFLSDANFLPLLLSYFSYSEWLSLYSANKQIQELLQSRILREFILERYLSTVGYSKWDYEWAEPLALSLKASSTLVRRTPTNVTYRIFTTIYAAWRCQHMSMPGFPLHTCSLQRRSRMPRRPLIPQIYLHWRSPRALTPESCCVSVRRLNRKQSTSRCNWRLN